MINKYQSQIWFFGGEGYFYLLLVYLFILLEYGCFTMSCQFLLYSKVNQLYIYTYPLFFRLSSHLGHHRALSRVPCAVQQPLISSLVYTQQSIHVNLSLPVHPTSPPPTLVTISLFSTSVTISVQAKFEPKLILHEFFSQKIINSISPISKCHRE